MTTESFLWHDYETFGANPRLDRPCQFAAQRTNLALEPIGKPVTLYCQPARDVLPVPEACLITGITPQIALEKGLPEYQFAAEIEQLMAEPGTCGVGYNNFRFDDEVTRFMFWRNFIDPYAREYTNGNSRFDLIDLLRMTAALRPGGIQWPARQDGLPSFRLEDLAAANGFDTEHAHDAMVDVNNTLALARLVQQHQPRLWSWALALRQRHQVERLLGEQRPILHTSARFGADRWCTAPVISLFQHPQISSQWLVWNLNEDPELFVEYDVETLEDLHFTPSSDLPEDMKRLPVKWVRSNRCPMLSPLSVLNDAALERTGIQLEQVQTHAERLLRQREFIERLRSLFGAARQHQDQDADTALYSGFVGRSDRQLCHRMLSMNPNRMAEFSQSHPEPFADPRLNDLLLRFLGRHAEATLAPEQQAEWQRYRLQRLVHDPDLGSIQLEDYKQRVQQLSKEQPERLALLQDLLNWIEHLELTQAPENVKSIT